MIQFEVIKSPDSNVIASFKFHRNDVYLGSSAGDLVIRDPALSKSHLMLEVVEGEFLVHPQKDVPFYLINGKRATSIRKIKAQDTLTIGGTQLKILAFSWTQAISKKAILNEKLNELMSSDSLRLPVIEKLSKMMK
jgi:hypothetical protein